MVDDWHSLLLFRTPLLLGQLVRQWNQRSGGIRVRLHSPLELQRVTRGHDVPVVTRQTEFAHLMHQGLDVVICQQLLVRFANCILWVLNQVSAKWQHNVSQCVLTAVLRSHHLYRRESVVSRGIIRCLTRKHQVTNLHFVAKCTQSLRTAHVPNLRLVSVKVHCTQVSRYGHDCAQKVAATVLLFHYKIKNDILGHVASTGHLPQLSHGVHVCKIRVNH